VKLLALNTFMEFHMELADMPQLTLTELSGRPTQASPVWARLRIANDAFQFVQFVSREPVLASAWFYPGDPMPDWVRELLNKVLPTDVGFSLIERNT
jgi:hypothetical protein